MPAFKDITNQRFGRLTGIRVLGQNRHGMTIWECRCDCSRISSHLLRSLVSGKTKSCGCLRKKARKHGLSATKLYGVWLGMKVRCYNPRTPGYKNYGGRGITVCDRWINSFENFVLDMGEPPSDKYSIERKNNSLGYTPKNCVWATRYEQNNNKRNNRALIYQKERLNITQWCQTLGLNKNTIFARIRRHWSTKKALSTPVRFRSK